MSIYKRLAATSFTFTCVAALAASPDPIPQAPVSHEPPAIPKTLAAPRKEMNAGLEEEEEEATQPVLAVTPIHSLSAVAPAVVGSTLTPPVTITYAGTANAVTINDSGTNRGLSSSLTNVANANSAVYGEAKGSGAGVKGINSGTKGSGGAFLINAATSPKAALTGTTSGLGSAITGTITTANSSQPAILGTNAVSPNYGIGVEGVGNDFGLYGIGSGTSGVGYGVYGYTADGSAGTAGLSSAGIGLFGESSSLYGVFGESSTSIGVYGYSVNSFGVYALGYKGDALNANSTYGRGITAHSANSIGIYASSDSSYGVWGQSKNQFGVIGEDSGTGVGVYGVSASGYAGYFAGKVAATAYLTVSDQNAKTDFAPVNKAEVLDLIDQLPITSWAFKDDRKLRHIGPMAQDFHAAFALNGKDDTHINLSDANGISLAAIQELNKRVKEKDQRIAALEAQVKKMNDTFSARLAKLETSLTPDPQIMTAYVSTNDGARTH